MAQSLTILYEDNHCLAVAKPPALLTQSASAEVPSLEWQAKAYLKERYLKKGNVYLGIPHRLDRPASGVVLFARNTKAARRLAEQFQKRQVVKIYYAAVAGDVEPESGTWEDWLHKVAAEARSERVMPDTPGAKHALLRYRRVIKTDAVSVLEIQTETGRMHQIRVQAAARGWPILGDALYGSVSAFGPAAPLPRDRAIALHARRLTFLHPIRFEPLTVTAPFPEPWMGLQMELSRL
jgi:23S rRNA pseudouridine1911/1915/1917 synthase